MFGKNYCPCGCGLNNAMEILKRLDNGWVMTELILYYKFQITLLNSNGTNFEGNESCGGWRRWYFQTSTWRELEECPTCTPFAFS